MTHITYTNHILNLIIKHIKIFFSNFFLYIKWKLLSKTQIKTSKIQNLSEEEKDKKQKWSKKDIKN